MADRGQPVPTPKAVRGKFANQTKTKKSPQKNPPKQNPSKTDPPLEPRVVVHTCSTSRSVRRLSPSVSTKPTIPTA